MNSYVLAFIIAHGIGGYHCDNYGKNVGYFRIFDAGEEVFTAVVPPGGGSESSFTKNIQVTSPSFKQDRSVYCKIRFDFLVDK